MKTTTKVTIGLSIAAVAGIATAVILSDKIVQKARYASNRCKARRFVESKFGGNEKVMDIVDSLSDEDLQSVVKVATKLKGSKKKMQRYGDSFKGTTKDLKEKLLQYLADFN